MEIIIEIIGEIFNGIIDFFAEKIFNKNKNENKSKKVNDKKNTNEKDK